MEGSKFPNKEYPYYFIKLGKLYYVNESCRNVKRKEISSYEFTNDELVAFPFDTQSIYTSCRKTRYFSTLNIYLLLFYKE